MKLNLILAALLLFSTSLSACVEVNRDTGVYTVDHSGCVKK